MIHHHQQQDRLLITETRQRILALYEPELPLLVEHVGHVGLETGSAVCIRKKIVNILDVFMETGFARQGTVAMLDFDEDESPWLPMLPPRYCRRGPDDRHEVEAQPAARVLDVADVVVGVVGNAGEVVVAKNELLNLALLRRRVKNPSPLSGAETPRPMRRHQPERADRGLGAWQSALRC